MDGDDMRAVSAADSDPWRLGESSRTPRLPHRLAAVKTLDARSTLSQAGRLALALLIVAACFGAAPASVTTATDQPLLAVSVGYAPGWGREIELVGLDGRRIRIDPHPPFPFDGAWSPDGTRVAFSGGEVEELESDEIGARNQWSGIYTMSASGSDVRLLYAPARADAPFDPQWSPDGRSLAFAAASGLWVVGADGHGARRVAAVDLSAFSWAPDGRRLAIGGCRNYNRADCAIYTVRADGTRLRRITRRLTRREKDDEIIPTSPSWSPDGKSIAFTRDEYVPAPEVDVVGSDGHGEHRVAHGEQPVWSPDGHRLVFVASSGTDENGSGIPAGVGVVSAAGGRPRLIANPKGAETDPTWSADGTRVVFAVGTRTYVGDPDHGGARLALTAAGTLPVTPTPNQRWARTGRHILVTRDELYPRVVRIVSARGVDATFSSYSDGAPAWAADGRRLAFVRTTGEKPYKQVYVLDTHQGRPRRLVAGDAPVWSPDGRSIAFELGGAVFVVSTAGERSRRLGRGSGPSWSPDGQTIAYGAKGLFLVSAQGGTPRRIDRGLGCWDPPFGPASGAADPAWSHDGRWIAFTLWGGDPQGDATSCAAMAAITTDALTQRQLPFGVSPHWVPDDSRIVFFTLADEGPGAYQLATVSADGSDLRILGPAVDSSKSDGDPGFSLSPDGGLIAFGSLGAFAPEVWIIGINGEGRRRLVGDADDPAWRP